LPRVVSSAPVEDKTAGTGFARTNAQAHDGRAESACVVASPIPLLMLATVVVLRGGFAIPTTALARAAGISLLIVNIGAFGSRRRWFICGPALSLLSLLAIAGFGLIRFSALPHWATVLAVAGAVLFLWNMVSLTRYTGVARLAWTLLLGTFLGLYAESMYWQSGTEHNVLYPEAILTGLAHTDVAEQSAVVQMISTYRVASTGINGLLPLKYHNGSLWLGEAFRALCGFQALDYVSFGYGLLLIPLYAWALFSAAEMLRQVLQGESGPVSLTYVGACLYAFVGLFPYVNNPLLLNFNENILNLDSFLLVLALSLLLLGITVRLYENARARDFELGFAEQLLLSSCIPSALLMVGFVKISQTYLLLALLVYLCWRVPELQTWPLLTATALSFALMIWLMHSEVGANRTRIALFNFDRIAPEWVPYFFVFYFTWLWLLVIVWAHFRQIRTLGDALQAIRSRDSILVELTWVAAGAGLLPYLLLDFYSYAWKFFLEFHAILAGVFVAGYIPEIHAGRLWQQVKDRSLRIPTALAGVLLLGVAGHLFITTTGAFYRLLKGNGEIRAALGGHSPLQWRGPLGQLGARSSHIADSLAPRLRTKECLLELGKLPKTQLKSVALYIPKTNRTYWDMREAVPGATPFLAPALSGIAMVYGLPEYEDLGWAAGGFGYPQFQLPTHPEPPVDKTPEAVEKARADGFRDLLVFEEASAQGCRIRTIKLDAPSGPNE